MSLDLNIIHCNVCNYPLGFTDDKNRTSFNVCRTCAHDILAVAVALGCGTTQTWEHLRSCYNIAHNNNSVFVGDRCHQHGFIGLAVRTGYGQGHRLEEVLSELFGVDIAERPQQEGEKDVASGSIL